MKRRSRLSGKSLGIGREALVTCYDPEYKATKLVKQGKAALEPVMSDLAEWVASEWHVAVLKIIHDHIDVSHKTHPRLQVIVEHSHERQKFFDGHNFDPLKQQAIAARFAEVAKGQGPARYDADGLLSSSRNSPSNRIQRRIALFGSNGTRHTSAESQILVGVGFLEPILSVALCLLVRVEHERDAPEAAMNCPQVRIGDPLLQGGDLSLGNLVVRFFPRQWGKGCVHDSSLKAARPSIGSLH